MRWPSKPDLLRHRFSWRTLLIIVIMLVLFLLPQPTAWGRLLDWDKPANQQFSFISDIYEDISPAVVGVDAISPTDSEDSDELQYGSGSGLIFSEDGYIITNYHVVSGALEVQVTLADGRSAIAEVIATEPAGDLALLHVDLDNLPIAPLGNSDNLRVGDVVFPIGNPGGEQFARSMTMGLISGIDRQLLLEDGNLYSLLQTDAAINPGNSGGPLVNCSGEVVGINSVKIVNADFEAMGFAIPINTVRAMIDESLPGAVKQ